MKSYFKPFLWPNSRSRLLLDLPAHCHHPLPVLQSPSVFGHSCSFYRRISVHVCSGTRWEQDHRCVEAYGSTVQSVYFMFSLLCVFCLSAFSALRDHIGWRKTIVVIGALQSTIIICGALLRPIIIKDRISQKMELESLSPKEHEALSAQGSEGVPVPEGSITNTSSQAQGTSYSLDNELTQGCVSTGDFGVQSLKDTGSGSTEDKALLQIPEDSGETKLSETENMDKKRTKDKSEEARMSQKVTKLLDFSILRECNFILYCLFGLFATLGFFAPQLYVVELSVSRGVGRDRAAYMLSTMAVSEILGRFSIGWVLTRNRLRKHKLLVILVCVIIMTADLVGFTLVREFYGLAVCCAVYGFFMGTLACTHIPLLAEDDVVGIDKMPSAAGVYVFIQSFAGLAGPPLGGKCL